MRIKTVLRDSDILEAKPGSKERVTAAAEKNLDRLVSLSSLLKVMGFEQTQRTDMLRFLETTNLHIWLSKEGQQDVIFISKGAEFVEVDGPVYQWQ